MRAPSFTRLPEAWVNRDPFRSSVAPAAICVEPTTVAAAKSRAVCPPGTFPTTRLGAVPLIRYVLAEGVLLFPTCSVPPVTLWMPAEFRKSRGPDAPDAARWSTIDPPEIVVDEAAAVPRSKLALVVDELPAVFTVTVPPLWTYVIVLPDDVTANRPAILSSPPSTDTCDPDGSWREWSASVPTWNDPAEILRPR